MIGNLFRGISYLAIAGVANGTFCVPFRKVRGWSWETYWHLMALVAWLILPCLGAVLTVPHVLDVLTYSPLRSILAAYLFGVSWGIGAVAFGLGIRYLGLSLGMAMVLGTCAAARV